eukprot:TRINITY_DN16698_c0_g1_i2.p1 TRINITY_DN16698_c0_g1~~TRINITY_DN16698_c0_g1_i2.p1  ORF type:complete len:262 (-),score=71.16 TRINITY_DN16698_c0_g1_i2:538-1221(-)
MSDVETKDECLFKVEKAASNRSKCKISGERIEAGELRVGVEGYMGGRVLQNWIKPAAFMEKCSFEYSPNNRARCRKTGDPLNKNEVRFVYCSSSTQKAYLKPAVVPELLDKILKAAKFDPCEIEGIDSLSQDDQKKIKKLLKDIKFDEEIKEEEEEEEKDEGDQEEEKEKKSPKKSQATKKGTNGAKKSPAKRNRKSESESTEADDSDKPILSNKKQKRATAKKEDD